MAELVLTDAYVSVGGHDVSDHVKSVTLNKSVNLLDDTVMGDTTKSNVGGLKDWSLDIELVQDYAATSMDVWFEPLHGTACAVVVRPVKGTVVGPTNPEYRATGILTYASPIAGAVGALAVTKLTLVPGGATPTLSRNES